MSYNVYLSATSPVDTTDTPVTTLTGLVDRITCTNLSLPYIAVVVDDLDGTTPLSAAYMESGDVIAPIASDATPYSTGAPIDRTIVITFSEDIDPSSGKVYLNEALLTDAPAAYGPNTYEFPYSGFAYETGYTIRIEGFNDAAGNTMITNNSFSFTTLAASAATGDNVPPEVRRTYNNSADSIYISGANKGNIAITFNEPMSSIYGTVILTPATGTPITLPDAGTWSADSTVYTILYSGLTTGTEYTVTVRNFRDLSNNVMVAHDADDNKFTAGGDDTAAPSVGVTGISTPETGSDKLVFTFSESMDGSAVHASITLNPAIGLLTPGFWSNDNTTYTVTTTADFNAAQTPPYTATFAGFKDASDNDLLAATGIDVTLATVPAPAVSSITPANGATGVAIDGDVVITFSEAMDDAIAGNVVLNDGTTDLPLDASVVTRSSGNTYTIAYTGLANSTAYTIKVSGFTNTSGVAMADNSSNSFTTIAAAPVTYTLAFDAQGGSVTPSTMPVTAGAAVGTLPTPARTDYTFDGWFTGTGATGTQYTAATIATGNVTLYAAWTAVPPAPDPDPTPDPDPVPDPDPTDPTNPTGVEEAPQSAKVWASNQQLHIYTPQTQKVRIYTIIGRLNKQLTLSPNETLAISLQRGIYIVTFENDLRQKVLIK
ncbi:hypothetical protein FACS1894181_17510 [Bacteroidia bacterium]|nr:hypothetical protein FACS1894181_17510 [Bacteroidia bacterium]